MDKDLGLLDDFFRLLKKFFLWGFSILALIFITIAIIDNVIMKPKGEFKTHPSNMQSENNNRECECIRLIVDDMRADNMTFLQIKRLNNEVWEFKHRYENGEETTYTHQWKCYTRG